MGVHRTSSRLCIMRLLCRGSRALAAGACYTTLPCVNKYVRRGGASDSSSPSSGYFLWVRRLFGGGFAFWLLYYYQVQGCDYVTRSRWGRAFAGGRWLVGGWRIQWDWFNWFLIGAVFVEGLEIGICSESITIPGFSLSDWMSNREITENISSIHHQPPPRI